MAGKSVIGIDLGPSVVKMVEYSPKKGEVLTIAKLFLKPLELKSETEVYQKIAEWVREKKQSPRAELVIGLPASRAVVRHLEIPEGSQGIQKNVQWELEQYLSESIDSYVYDIFLQDKSNALVAAFKKEQATQYKNSFDSKDLPLSILDVDIFATLNCFEANYPEEISNPVYVIKADVHGILSLRVEKMQWGHFGFTSLPAEYTELESGPEKTEIIQSAVDAVAVQLEKSAEPKPTKVFYCGDLVTDVDFTKTVQEALPLEWIPLNAFRKITFPHEPEHQQKVEETAPQCATALGLALRMQGDSP